MVRFPTLGTKAFTLFELLIAVLMISMVFAGTTSVYLSSLKFLKTAQQTDVTINPSVSLETISKVISLGNDATLTNGGSQLNIRADYAMCSDFTTSLTTPANNSDDNYWHYMLIGGAVRATCGNNNIAASPVDTNSPILISNATAFSITWFDPSGTGLSTISQISVTTSSPPMTLTTKVAMRQEAKAS